MEPDEFFARRGYRLDAELVDGIWWAHLVDVETGEVVWSRYGRGDSEPAARRRAMKRWIVEQAT